MNESQPEIIGKDLDEDLTITNRDEMEDALDKTKESGISLGGFSINNANKRFEFARKGNDWALAEKIKDESFGKLKEKISELSDKIQELYKQNDQLKKPEKNTNKEETGNFNDNIKIRPNIKGLEILQYYYENIKNELPNEEAKKMIIAPKPDKEGYVEMPMHEVFRIYGKYLNPSQNPPFEMNFKISKKQ